MTDSTDEELHKLKMDVDSSEKRAEEALKISEEKFRKALATIPDSVNINRLSDGMYISVNQGFCRIMGYSEEEVVGKTSVELNIWGDQENRKQLTKLLDENGYVENFESVFRHRNGKIIKGLMSASLIEFDGEPHILNVTRDITEQKKIEDDLRREQFLLRALLDNLPDHIYFKDAESRFIRNSKSHALSFGLTDPGLLFGRSDFDFFSKEAAQQAFEDEKSIMSTRQPVFKEEMLTRKDNTVAWFSAMKLPLLDAGSKVIGTFGISKEITGRKRTELENHVIYEITQGFTSTYNLDELLVLIHRSLSKVVYAENIFVALYNYSTGLFSFPYFVDQLDTTPSPMSLAKSCTAYVFRTVRPFLFKQEVFDKLCEQNEVEQVGSESPSWIGIPLQIQSKVIGVLVLQHYEKENVYSENDVKFLTSVGNQIAIAIERKKAEEEINLKNEQLMELNAEKDKFFSIIAHDLRGPFSSFVAATQILTEEIQTMKPEDVSNITLSMKKSASNIYSLLDNLLEWSQMKRGGISFYMEKLDLMKYINEGVEIFGESARKKEIGFSLSVPEGMSVVADKHMLETIIRNLISNAIKFSLKGGMVEIAALQPDENFIEVRFKDFGIGMKQELKNRLFMINERTSRTGTAGELSTGLGLLLCKEFIEKCGGVVTVESEEGKGSTFSITLMKFQKNGSI